MNKDEIKQLIFDFMFQVYHPDEVEQIEFDNTFEKWWKERNND